MPADHVPESPGARRPAEESTAATSDGERLATMADESAAMSGTTAGATSSSEVEARATDAVLESRTERPIVPEEQAACPETS